MGEIADVPDDVEREVAFRTASEIEAERIARKRAMGEWQPIETAPKDGRWFLGADENTEFAYRARWDGRSFKPEGAIVDSILYGAANYWAPTHWSPLLDPPWMVPAPPAAQRDMEAVR